MGRHQNNYREVRHQIQAEREALVHVPEGPPDYSDLNSYIF